jgi:hypothetical protein
MKKLNLWLLLSLFVAAFTLSACGSDDDDDTPPANTNPLVGTWESTGTGAFEPNAEVSTRYKLVIGNDNSIKFDYRMYAHGSALHNAYQMRGIYTVKDNVITVTYSQFSWVSTEDGVTILDNEDTDQTYQYTYKFENNNLLISGDDDSNGGILDNVVFVKK